MTVTQSRLKELARFAQDLAFELTRPYAELQAFRDIEIAVNELHALISRAEAAEPVATDGELWSWVRSVMSQGVSINQDYAAGNLKGYEAYSARLDAAARERADELLARLQSSHPAPTADSERLTFLVEHRIIVRGMADTGLFMLLDATGYPVSGEEYETANAAIDAARRIK